MKKANLLAGLVMCDSGKVVCGFCQSGTPGGVGTGVAACCSNRENLLRDELARPKFKFDRTETKNFAELTMFVGGKRIASSAFEREYIPRGLFGLLGNYESWERACERMKQTMLDGYYEKLRLERDLSDA